MKKASVSQQVKTEVPIASKSTPISALHAAPSTQPATPCDDKWITEMRVAMEEGGLALLSHQYKKARLKYSICLELLSSNSVTPHESIGCNTSTVRHDQQAVSHLNIDSELMLAMNAAGTVIDMERYKKAQAAFRRCLQRLSEETQPVSGDQVAKNSRLYSIMPLLCYACGVAFVKSAAVLEELQIAIEFFNVMQAGDRQNVWFSLAYYGLGTAAISQYRYKDAKKHFETGLQALNMSTSSCLASLRWPGTTTPLDEFHNAEKAFRKALVCAIYRAPSDGRCVYSVCLSNGHEQREIYESSLDFKGCTMLTCTDGCRVYYHSKCWLSMKLLKWSKLTDKEILGKSCFTPDCEGRILSITGRLWKGGKQKLSEIFLPLAVRTTRPMKVRVHPTTKNIQVSTKENVAIHSQPLSALCSKACGKTVTMALPVSNTCKDSPSKYSEVLCLAMDNKQTADNSLPANESETYDRTAIAKLPISDTREDSASIIPLLFITGENTSTDIDSLPVIESGTCDKTTVAELLVNDTCEDSASSIQVLHVTGENQYSEDDSGHSSRIAYEDVEGSSIRHAIVERDTAKPLASLPKKDKKRLQVGGGLRYSIQLNATEGGNALVCQKYSTAETKYETCLTLMASVMPNQAEFQDDLSTQIIDRPLLCYAAGFACVQQNTKQGVLRGINHFSTIINYSDTIWPMAYYGRGQGLMKIGSYRHAAADFTKGLTTMNQPERTLYWPGTAVTIPESIGLKEKFKSALLLCRYPPIPVARCVFKRCRISNFSEREIYDGLCQYEGFVSIVCSEKCIINYHNHCWKDATLLFWGKPTDKGVLGQQCLTPNCDGRLMRITVRKHNNGEDLKTEKIYHASNTSKGPGKNKFPTASVRPSFIPAIASQPSSSHCPKRATAQQGHGSSRNNSFLQAALFTKGESEAQSSLGSTREIKFAEEAPVSSQTLETGFFDGEVPMIITKKELDSQEKESQPNSLHSRVGVPIGVLRPHIVAQTFINSDDPTLPKESQSLGDYAIASNFQTAENSDFSSISVMAVHTEPLQQQEQHDEICQKIVRFFEEHLKENSPLDVQDIAITEFLVSKLTPQALDIVSANGGIGGFLTKYEQFSLIEGYICLCAKPELTSQSVLTWSTQTPIQGDNAVTKGTHSRQKTSANLDPTISDDHRQTQYSNVNILESTSEAQATAISSTNNVTPASSAVLTLGFSSTTSSTDAIQPPVASPYSNNAVPPILLVSCLESDIDNRSGTDTCGNSQQSEVFRSLSARDDTVVTDLLDSVHNKTTLSQNFWPLDSKQQAIHETCNDILDGLCSTSNQCLPGKYATRAVSDADVQVDGLQEECRILELTLTTKMTEAMKLTIERDSLLEQLKIQQSQTMSQIQDLTRQVSQLSNELAEAKREAQLDRAKLGHLSSCILHLLHVDIEYHEKERAQKELTSAELKKVERNLTGHNAAP